MIFVSAPSTQGHDGALLSFSLCSHVSFHGYDTCRKKQFFFFFLQLFPTTFTFSWFCSLFLPSSTHAVLACVYVYVCLHATCTNLQLLQKRNCSCTICTLIDRRSSSDKVHQPQLGITGSAFLLRHIYIYICVLFLAVAFLSKLSVHRF
jgi:hypothetical protein